MKTFGLSLTLIAAAAVTGCGQQQPKEWSASAPTQLCTDSTGKRVPDDYCTRRNSYGGGGFAYFPYFIGRGGYIPPYGDYARGGSRMATSGLAYGRAAPFTSTSRGFSSSAGGVSRGGFGSSAHGSGGAGE